MENTNITTKTYASGKLNQYTSRINKSFLDAKSSLFKAAVLLKEVKDNKFYEKDFANITEYAQDAFGIKKTACYAMLKVAEEYTNDDFTCNLPHTTKENFALSQVTEMLPLGKDKVIEVTESEIINPDMSTSEIRKIVKKLQKAENETESETEVESEAEVENKEADELTELINELAKYANDIATLLNNDKAIAITADYIQKIQALKTE